MNTVSPQGCNTTDIDKPPTTVIVTGTYPINGKMMPYANVVDQIRTSRTLGNGYNGQPNIRVPGTHIVVRGVTSGIMLEKFVPDEHMEELEHITEELSQQVRSAILRRFHVDPQAQ